MKPSIVATVERAFPNTGSAQARFCARGRGRRWLFRAGLTASLMLAEVELVLNHTDGAYTRSIAVQVVREAGAVTPREKVLALRDYLRQHVDYHEIIIDDRPFLRAAAAETLRTGEGYCGDVSRAFICMAGEVGVAAQRVSLDGREQHVVAEADLGPAGRVIVDCQQPPRIADLTPLDQVMLRPEYSEHYTINLRRLGLGWLVRRLTIETGAITYLAEHPHALLAAIGLGAAAVLIALAICRDLVRRTLGRRGWVHASDSQRLRAAAERLQIVSNPGPAGQPAGGS
jgi:hypothetical protein